MAKKWWQILKQSVQDFISDKVLRMSAALAYYTIFSLPPLLIIVIAIAEFFYGKQSTQVEGSIYSQIKKFVGNDAAIQIQEAIKNASLSGQGGVATVVGIIVLIFGATSIFGEIQDSLNYIWRVKAKPKKGWVKMLLNRLISFSMIISLSFLLLVSLLANALLDLLMDRIVMLFPDIEIYLAYAVNSLLTFVITAILFGGIFKVLPDARIRWRDVRAGAMVTALLFMLGRFLIGYYLGHNKTTSAYGAAGSVLIILLWVYYSAMILYFGAEFTRVYAQVNGRRIYPNEYAVWIQEVEVDERQSLQEHPETEIKKAEVDAGETNKKV
jgi:membrane protein